MEKVNVRVTKLRRRKNGRVAVSPFYHLFWSVMKAMRHKTALLTMETYLDGEKVPVAGALAKLPEFDCSVGAARRFPATGSTLQQVTLPGKEHTGKDTGILVQGGQWVAKPVTIGNVLKGKKTLVNIGESHGLSPLVIFAHEKSNGGERTQPARKLVNCAPEPRRDSSPSPPQACGGEGWGEEDSNRFMGRAMATPNHAKAGR